MKLLSVCSARPNFVKLAAVHHAFEALKQPGDEHIIVHTGQHYDPLLSDVFFKQLAIPLPKASENLGVHGGTREEVIEKTKQSMIPALQKHKPDAVLVYGDVNGALGSAQAAKELDIKLAHVEAGLRSGDMDMPEEHNRIGIDELSDYLFVTEQSGMDNLLKEGCGGHAELVGNTMVDTLKSLDRYIHAGGDVIQKQLAKLPEGNYAIATLHRPSNVDDPAALKRNIDFLKRVATFTPITLPAHPRLRNAIGDLAANDPHLHITGPMTYIEFVSFMSRCAFILTDSGGIQEEAVLLKKRCFTLRKNTERPVTIECGSNVLIDLENAEDRQKVLDFATHPTTLNIKVPPLWDGKAGERILACMRRFLTEA